MRIAYRLGQFWQLVHPSPLSPEAWREIESVLSPAEMALFRRFGDADRRHGYRVMRALQETGEDESALLVAALLHDIGKTGVPVRHWERVMGTVGERFFAGRVKALGSGAAQGWRRSFAIRVQHAEWGAAMAEEAGCTPLAVDLIRRHQDKELDRLDPGFVRLLRRLQWADDQY